MIALQLLACSARARRAKAFVGVAAAQLRRRQLVDDYFRGRLFDLTVLNANRVSFFHHTWNSSTFGKAGRQNEQKGSVK
jgi:hypothetical protein